MGTEEVKDYFAGFLQGSYAEVRPVFPEEIREIDLQQLGKGMVAYR